MEKLFQSKFMIKLQDFGQKLGSNKFLSALQAAMMSLMGIIMVGAISQIICSVGDENFLKLFTAEHKIYQIIYLPYQFTMNLLSVWVVIFFAFHYAKNLKMKSPLMLSVNSLVCFFIVASPTLVTGDSGSGINMTYLGAQGMFIGFLVVFLAVNIEKFCADKDIRFKMPEVVPQFLQDGFSAILPLFFSTVIFVSLTTGVSAMTSGAYNVCSGFMVLLGKPLEALTSVPGMFIICAFAVILWCFGIHGTMILIPIIMPMMIQAAVANGAAHAAGEPLVFYPIALFSGLALCGGTGNTLPLALMGLRSKSKQISTVAKIGVIPGWFGINEPLTFGMPIMYNPILCIPYVLNVPIVMLLTYIGYQVGFLQPAWITIVALLPIGVGQYLSTLRWQNAIWDYLMIVPIALIYYPFFKVYEKQLIAKETKAQQAS